MNNTSLWLPAVAVGIAVLTGCGSDAPAEPAPAPTQTAEAATSADAYALTALVEADYADSQSYPRNHAAVMRLADEAGFAFSEGNVLQIYYARQDSQNALSLSFCVVNPPSRAWTLYDSVEDEYTTSTDGLVCQPMAAAQ